MAMTYIVRIYCSQGEFIILIVWLLFWVLIDFEIVHVIGYVKTQSMISEQKTSLV
jgi:hypothetical protein